MKRYAIYLVAIAAAMVIFAQGIASASYEVHVLSVTTFTSTADFDSGTKSSSGGNYQVETLTDNGGIATGTFELGSLKGDEFTFMDADGATAKWATKPTGSGSSNCAYSIGSGIYTISEPDNAGVEDCGVLATATVSGSMDVHAKLNFASGTLKVYEMCLMSTQECRRPVDAAYSGSANGVFYDNLVGTLQPAKVINGVVTFIGTTTSVATNPLWMRISRSGNDFTFYYSSDGSSWTTDETDTVTGIPTSLYPGWNQAHNGGAYGATSLTADSFLVAAGIVDSGGYRTSGNWKSAAQTHTDNLMRSVAITYAGASASNYITAISLINGAGSYVYVNNTDIISGSTHTDVVPDIQIAGTWTVQVNLTSGGAGTPTIQQVDVTHSANAAPTITNPISQDNVTSGVLYSRDFNSEDSDVGQTPIWTLVSNASGLSINQNGTVTGYVNVTGPYYVNVSISDGFGGSAFDNYTLNSQIPPPPPPPVIQLIDQAQLAVAALLVLMGFLIAITAIFIVLYGVRDRFLDPSLYKRGKS